MLMDALHRSLQAADGIGSMAVVVDAKDALAADFYLHFGFIPLNLSVSRLFLPMATIAKLFDQLIRSTAHFALTMPLKSYGTTMVCTLPLATPSAIFRLAMAFM